MGYKLFNCKTLAVRAACVSSDWGGVSGLKKLAKSKRKLSDRQAKTSLKPNQTGSSALIDFIVYFFNSSFSKFKYLFLTPHVNQDQTKHLIKIIFL